MAKKVMAWSTCQAEIGPTGANGAMAATLTSVGTIKDKSASLESSDGETLEAKATGGVLVAKETTEGGFKFTCRVIEPTKELLTLLGLGTEDGTEYKVNTHVVSGDFSLKITPKNVGAEGIKAPITSVTYKPGWSEEEGNYADLDFDILKGEGAGAYWYSRFVKTAAE